MRKRESFPGSSISIIQAVVKWFKFTVWATVTTTTCSRDSGVGCTLRRVGTTARGTWSRWKVSLGPLSECTMPLSLSEAAASGCQQIVYDALMNGCQGRGACYFTDFQPECKILCVACVCVCLGAVCAPEAQKDFSPTLQIQARCTAPSSASSVVTRKVITCLITCVCVLYVFAHLA